MEGKNIPLNLSKVLPGYFIILFIFLITPTILYARKDVGWKLEKDKNGVKCYTRMVKGFEFKEYKGEADIKSTLSGVVALFDDMGNAALWIDTYKKGRIFKRSEINESFTYSVYTALWPVDDRDAVVHNIITQDPVTKTIIIKVDGIYDYIPEVPGIVRVKKLTGFWKFVPQENGIVKVIYQMHSDPGGGLPAWLVNSFVVDQPYKTLPEYEKSSNL